MIEESAADVLIDFLRSAKNGNAVDQIAELNQKLVELKKAQDDIKASKHFIADKIKENQQIEHDIMVRHADLVHEQNKLQLEKNEFDAVKFKVKKDVEFVELTYRQINDKMGESDAKLKRLVLEEERVKGLESSMLAQMKKLDFTVKQINKLMSEI